MYMTIGDFQRKLNTVLKDIQQIDKNTLIVKAVVIGPGNVGFGEDQRAYPPGTVLFMCQNSFDKEGKVNSRLGETGGWYELSITPDRVQKWLQ